MIHNTAIIDKRAKISSNVKIGPYSIIGPDVEIEENTIIHSHVNLEGNTKIGKNNQIFPFSSIGTPPQDLKYKGEKNKLIIGDNNRFREYVNINPGTEITSPIIGTAYHAPEPGAKKFVEIGKKIKKGDTIMIVEAMKTMNHVPSTADGIVKEICVEDGHPVEFGQTIIILE